MTDGEQRLVEYVATGSETAFREVVERYLNLVYSAALRLVNGDSHLAEDVAQKVFADLARMAGKLSRGVMLGGWLHRHTCFVANNTMRAERRRQLRERSAVEMNSIEDHSEANLALIAPVLDEAINELGSDDRAAVLLRFFEQKDFRAVGEALGSNEEAARKRVNRALGKLHTLLTRRGVVLSATGLAATLSSQVVTAAPAGLALTISTTAVATATATGGTALTFLQIMSMTKVKIGVVTVVIAAIAIPLAVEHRDNRKLREENEALRSQLGQIDKLAAENARLAKLATQANAATPPVASNDQYREVLKLRGEVGALRTAANAPKPSPLSAVISDPEMRKMIRDQQKVGMSMLYKEFGNRLKLTSEQTQQFVDMLADDIMENVDHVGAALRDGTSREDIDRLFSGQEAALQEKIKELLGQDGLTAYQDYTKNLASYLTAEQFKAQLTGDKAAKDEKSKLLYQAMLEETQAALGAAGLPADYQTLPILNFRNFASEHEAENNLRFMDSIYERVGARANAFLSPEEVNKFNDFRAKALENNRMSLAVNRRMMAPGGK
ncbi:MAG: sigma-70 family RNA polymerase sigma factor [Verrucomicrobia subdivision 3 bacterium]|nr:sigma-70 family RNA polymerase sigma factor [Limisphaerales bacterium]